jgi:hypothetical protein
VILQYKYINQLRYVVLGKIPKKEISGFYRKTYINFQIVCKLIIKLMFEEAED